MRAGTTVEVQVIILMKSELKEKTETTAEEIFNHNDYRFSSTAERNMQDRKEDFGCEFRTKVHPDKTLAATLEGLFTSRTCRRKKTRHPLGVETEETNKTYRPVETSLRDSPRS
jgi:hypothetical protein